MTKPDLVLNNVQWLICHKTKLNQTKPEHSFFVVGRDLTALHEILSVYAKPH